MKLWKHEKIHLIVKNFPFLGRGSLLAFFYLLCLHVGFLLRSPADMGITNGTPAPVNEWSILAIPLVIDTSINGTVGNNEKDIYSFSASVAEKVNITVTPIESFRCILSIYDENGSRIGAEFVGNVKGSIEIAPELNVNYLIVVTPYGNGGSYILNISSSQE